MRINGTRPRRPPETIGPLAKKPPRQARRLNIISVERAAVPGTATRRKPIPAGRIWKTNGLPPGRHISEIFFLKLFLIARQALTEGSEPQFEPRRPEKAGAGASTGSVTSAKRTARSDRALDRNRIASQVISTPAPRSGRGDTRDRCSSLTSALFSSRVLHFTVLGEGACQVLLAPCAVRTGCCFCLAMDAPARPSRFHAGAREGLARERRLDARLMQLITEQVEHV